MSEDWRLKVTVHGHGLTHALVERMATGTLQDDLVQAFADRVVVSVDGPELFCYAGTREQAERARALIEQITREQEWTATVELTRWHPTSEQWKGPDEPLPMTDAEREAEHAERVEADRRATIVQGYPEWEVRVECASRHDAAALAETFSGQGLRTVRRFRFLLLGALDEDSAGTLAERVRGLVPPGTTVTVEGSGRAIADDVGGNPFAVFGGLGG